MLVLGHCTDHKFNLAQQKPGSEDGLGLETCGGVSMQLPPLFHPIETRTRYE